MLIYKALGFEQPTFGHVSLILAGDKSKLSKRWAAVEYIDDDVPLLERWPGWTQTRNAQSRSYVCLSAQQYLCTIFDLALHSVTS